MQQNRRRSSIHGQKYGTYRHSSKFSTAKAAVRDERPPWNLDTRIEGYEDVDETTGKYKRNKFNSVKRSNGLSHEKEPGELGVPRKRVGHFGSFESALKLG